MFVKLCNFFCGTVSASTIQLILIGPGQVGSELLSQIDANNKTFHDKYELEIQLIGLANHNSMYFTEGGISLKNWRSDLKQNGEPLSINLLLESIIKADFNNLVFVDCTSDQNVADLYPQILKAGIPIVTPNKKAASGSLDRYKTLKALGIKVPFYFDPNVGAGLPILNTINELVRSGDNVVKVEAVLSGTLSYIFNTFDGSIDFSEIVLDAQRKGYTEPDPRDDLNGMDVARKLLIIAREAGYPLEMEDIILQPFLPEECFSASSVDDFYVKLKGYDKTMSELVRKAQTQGKKLRFIAALENGKATVSLQSVGPDQAVFHLTGNDNIIAISSKYYSKNPLVIKGPGAGTTVTAAKTLEGIIRIGLR